MTDEDDLRRGRPSLPVTTNGSSAQYAVQSDYSALHTRVSSLEADAVTKQRVVIERRRLIDGEIGALKDENLRLERRFNMLQVWVWFALGTAILAGIMVTLAWIFWGAPR